MAEENFSIQQINQSFVYCEQVARGSSFYMGMMLTEKKKRHALLALYAWFRAVDDIVDSNATQSEKVSQLMRFKILSRSVLQDSAKAINLFEAEPFWVAYSYAVNNYHMPLQYLDRMIAGQEQDLVRHNYNNFQELYWYCRNVASVVGSICVTIWGLSESTHRVRQMIEWCGIAFQLTNILRDIKDDAKQGYIYIPAEYFGLSELTAESLLQTDEQVILTL